MKTAMILAAGRGKRLRPLTDYLPKALCPVQQKPLIEHQLLRLKEAGIERVVINHAHLGDQIRRRLGKGQTWGLDLIYSPEPPGGLETGGGIYHALPLLGKAPFIAVNADIFTDFNFGALSLDEGLAKLVLIDKNPPLSADFSIDAQGYLNNRRQYTYSGIAVYHPELFLDALPGRFSVIPLIRAAAQKNLIQALLYKGLWFDGGTEAALQAANLSQTAHQPATLYT